MENFSDMTPEDKLLDLLAEMWFDLIVNLDEEILEPVKKTA